MAKQTTNEFVSLFALNDKTRICEMAVVDMSSPNSIINVDAHPSINMDVILRDDNDPQFVNVEVIRAGVSNNNRRYTNQIIEQISEMIPGTQGFFGHPDPSKHGFEFREPQCIYVGSHTEMMPDGMIRCIAKAYLFKSSKLREWIPKSIAAGNPMTVSINGRSDVIRNGDMIELVRMTELESIDWANPGTEGMETSKAMSIVQELENKNIKGGLKMDNLSAQDIIKNMTIAEFRTHNPSGYDNILKDVSVSELQAVNPEVVSKIIENNKVTEMTLSFGGQEEKIKLDAIQSKVDSYESKITELQGKLDSAEIDSYKSQLITEMVDEKYRESFMKRVTGSNKDEIKASIETEIAYVREMGGAIGNNGIPGVQNRRNISDDKDGKNLVNSMFGIKPNKE